jgi:hypothetical protein
MLLVSLVFREMSSNHLFGAYFAVPIRNINRNGQEAKMGILILKIMVSWSIVAMIMGFFLGAAIGRGERVRRDEFLSCVFATLETMQASRS